jgi:hypothetical protein
MAVSFQHRHPVWLHFQQTTRHKTQTPVPSASMRDSTGPMRVIIRWLVNASPASHQAKPQTVPHQKMDSSADNVNLNGFAVCSKDCKTGQ